MWGLHCYNFVINFMTVTALCSKRRKKIAVFVIEREREREELELDGGNPRHGVVFPYSKSKCVMVNTCDCCCRLSVSWQINQSMSHLAYDKPRLPGTTPTLHTLHSYSYVLPSVSPSLSLSLKSPLAVLKYLWDFCVFYCCMHSEKQKKGRILLLLLHFQLRLFHTLQIVGWLHEFTNIWVNHLLLSEQLNRSFSLRFLVSLFQMLLLFLLFLRHAIEFWLLQHNADILWGFCSAFCRFGWHFSASNHAILYSLV